MDSQGHIHHLNADEMDSQKKRWEKGIDVDEVMEAMEDPLMAPITDEEEAKLKLQSLPRRKNYMKNQPCPCGSGNKFKKCCWSKAAKFGMRSI